jgi:hypothetical protein
MVLIDRDLLPRDSPSAALNQLQEACPAALSIILISHLDARHPDSLSASADAFIGKSETSDLMTDACGSRRRAFALSDATWLSTKPD